MQINNSSIYFTMDGHNSTTGLGFIALDSPKHLRSFLSRYHIKYISLIAAIALCVLLCMGYVIFCFVYIVIKRRRRRSSQNIGYTKIADTQEEVDQAEDVFDLESDPTKLSLVTDPVVCDADSSKSINRESFSFVQPPLKAKASSLLPIDEEAPDKQLSHESLLQKSNNILQNLQGVDSDVHDGNESESYLLEEIEEEGSNNLSRISNETKMRLREEGDNNNSERNLNRDSRSGVIYRDLAFSKKSDQVIDGAIPNSVSVTSATLQNNPTNKNDSIEPIVTDIKLSAVYYKNDEKLNVNVTHLNLEVNQVLDPNPFICIFISLLPDETYCRSDLCPLTSTVTFEKASTSFEVSIEDICSKLLKIEVYLSDSCSPQKSSGRFIYKLVPDIKSAADNTSSSVPITLVLQEENPSLSEAVQCLGQLSFALSYNLTTGCLTLRNINGKNMTQRGFSNLYIRISFMISGKAMKTLQTSKAMSSSIITFNDSYVFHTPLILINETEIVLTVMGVGCENEKDKKDLGKVVVGPKSSSRSGRSHWRTMLDCPNKYVTKWHTIV